MSRSRERGLLRPGRNVSQERSASPASSGARGDRGYRERTPHTETEARGRPSLQTPDRTSVPPRPSSALSAATTSTVSAREPDTFATNDFQQLSRAQGMRDSRSEAYVDLEVSIENGMPLLPLKIGHVFSENPALRTSCYRLVELGQFRRYSHHIWNHVWEKMSTNRTVEARDHRLPDYHNNIGAVNIRSFYEIVVSIASQHLLRLGTDFDNTSVAIAHRVRKHHDLYSEAHITSTAARKQFVLETGRWYLFTRKYEDYFPTAWREAWVALAGTPWPSTFDVNNLSVSEALRLFSELPEDLTVFHFSGEIEWHILQHYRTIHSSQEMLDNIMQRYSARLVQSGRPPLQHPLTSDLPLWLIIEELMAAQRLHLPVPAMSHQSRLSRWEDHWTAVLLNNETAIDDLIRVARTHASAA